MDTEMRVTVIGDQVFAARVKPLQDNSVDWRRRPEQADVSKVDLSADTRMSILRMTRNLGLSFGCFDFACARDGRVIFLEVNPSGQWYWVEQRTGLPLLESFIDTMLSRTT